MVYHELTQQKPGDILVNFHICLTPDIFTYQQGKSFIAKNEQEKPCYKCTMQGLNWRIILFSNLANLV